MKFGSVFSLIILMLISSCATKTNNTKSKMDSGLLIENRINRGINYTNLRGDDRSIRYIPITITNDTTIPIQFQLNFSKEYYNPKPYDEETFKLVPLPTEWALDGVDITENMIVKIPNYIEDPSITKSLEPGEQFVFAIGSIYPRPARSTGVLPRTLFSLTKVEDFTSCEWLMDKEPRSNERIPLGLKVVFGDKCQVIPCGWISYPKN